MLDGTQPALILWDIDHTLVSIPGLGREVYSQAFEAVFGRPLGEVGDMLGRTERAIILETLALNGIADGAAEVDRMYLAVGEAAARLDGRLRVAGRRLAGSREAIDVLARPAVVQSLVTGNIRVVAKAKLEAFDLLDGIDLEVGGYGDHGTDRADLVRRARELAGQKYGYEVPADRTIVIGDTPHDVRGAHDAGVLAFAVASGLSGVDELSAAGADAVLADLRDTTAVERTVFGKLLGDE